MAKILSNKKVHRVLKRRDKAQSDIVFNENYFAIAKTLLEEKREQSLKRKEIRVKRKLYPLEKRATSPKDRLMYEMELELSKLNKKQRLPRLAVEQSYIRRYITKGKEIAEPYYKNALAKLDAKAESIRDKWSARALKAESECSEKDVERYHKALEEENKKLEVFKHQSKVRLDKNIQRLEEKTNRQIAKSEAYIEKYNKQLESLGDSTQDAMKNSDSVLEVNDLVMQFGGVVAVNHLSFNVREGEIFGLIGPNGAGKTTVFNCITQFNKPKNGTIYYRSQSGEVVDLVKKKVHNVISTGIVRTFQNVELIWELSVLDNMLIGAHSLFHAHFFDHLLHSKKLRREEKVMRARALDVLERLNLLDYKDMIPFGLPYGILKKIELARTLMVKPRLIILDEPAAGLNETETEELAETILKIRDDYGCTIFLVEHDMGLVMDICDTVCAISFGKMLALGTPHDIQTSAVVQEAYLGGTIGEDDNE